MTIYCIQCGNQILEGEKGERVWRKNGQLKWKESGLNMRLKWSFNVFLRFPGGFAEEDQPISSSRMRVH